MVAPSYNQETLFHGNILVQDLDELLNVRVILGLNDVHVKKLVAILVVS